MDKIKYFNRIGLDNNTKIEQTYEFLKKLQYAHCISVPYENLDLIDGKLLSLETEGIWKKIVEKNRGGYCFEINKLISDFLKENGFTVKNYLGRFLRGMKELPVRHHRVLCVTIGDERYILDAGIGQSAPRYPLKLITCEIQEQFGEKYKFEKDSFLGWVLMDLHKGNWRPFYSFTEDEQLDIDFILPSFYCERHPDSRFNKTPMVSIKTENGRKTLDDRTFKIFKGISPVYMEEDISDERRVEILKEEFGIVWGRSNLCK